ncbi:hypothetical protein HTSR_1352 [Halodesulfurarchaeum formicicum]|uniref:Uncharacterized protein n=1 Tax=Halodesulfurarchaeum formicicum TaxID=1873524 RepID=A0A1D8S591_9EURY|nr:hypothetical protein [Halodesulfurarchaeum formicicum]AOW80528.1 hypothetical protein HTSR_1352 [Halodesulfurarchaeum formicicum]APE95867.1 hypothetical protein HSR6_1424 [Halodesulfurarchaeum formicicum]
MGDTKRGRERKGQKKREQRIRQEIDETLDAADEPPVSDAESPDVTETDLENVSIVTTEDEEEAA